MRRILAARVTSRAAPPAAERGASVRTWPVRLRTRVRFPPAAGVQKVRVSPDPPIGLAGRVKLGARAGWWRAGDRGLWSGVVGARGCLRGSVVGVLAGSGARALAGGTARLGRRLPRLRSG